MQTDGVSSMRIAIFGQERNCVTYENFITAMPAVPIVTLDPDIMSCCDALLLPGGGDITPAFFGEHNNGSRHIDTALDVLQLQALHFCIRKGIPVLGICKGMQLINVAFGGTITQHMPTAFAHDHIEGDQYHETTILESSCLYELYGKTALVNSAHHQSIHQIGKGLLPIQWCNADGCIEAIVHDTLPILGLQWHPERLDPFQTSLDGKAILSLFMSWIAGALSQDRHAADSFSHASPLFYASHTPEKNRAMYALTDSASSHQLP